MGSYLTYYADNTLQPLPVTQHTLTDFSFESLIQEVTQQQPPEYLLQIPSLVPQAYRKTITAFYPDSTAYSINTDEQQLLDRMKQFYEREKHWLAVTAEQMHEHYIVFNIPKASGGVRTIKAPKEELKEAQTRGKQTLEQLGCLAHNAAFAYVKQRSTLHAIQLHQNNESKWFLKVDIKKFFDNCTPEMALRMLEQLHPFAHLLEYSRNNQNMHNALNFLELILHLNTLDNAFPQGTPLSPILTNLLMVPFDYHLKLRLGEHYIYTRYADDILISSKYSFSYTYIVSIIKDVLISLNYNLELNNEKTRYGSSAGSNWNLGLMLNKNGTITIGHRRKKNIKAMLHNFFTDSRQFNLQDTQALVGEMAYFKHTEPETYERFMLYIKNKYLLQVHPHEAFIRHLKLLSV